MSYPKRFLKLPDEKKSELVNFINSKLSEYMRAGKNGIDEKVKTPLQRKEFIHEVAEYHLSHPNMRVDEIIETIITK